MIVKLTPRKSLLFHSWYYLEVSQESLEKRDPSVGVLLDADDGLLYRGCPNVSKDLEGPTFPVQMTIPEEWHIESNEVVILLVKTKIG
jgi:hypothetical protein